MSSAFVQAAVILLREGLEAMLGYGTRHAAQVPGPVIDDDDLLHAIILAALLKQARVCYDA